jgi:hypothetical protein
MLKNITLPVFLTTLGLLVSTFVLFFGNNILQKFQRAEIVYVSQQMELKFPDKFTVQLIRKSDSIPNLYREIRIKNVGGMPSTKLKIAIELDGSVYDVQTSCIENITSVKTSGSKIEITLDRLAKGAEIICKLWLIQRPGTFSITSIDDQGINDVKIYLTSASINWLQVISTFAIILLSSFLIYRFYFVPLKNRNLQLTEQSIELQNQNDFLQNEANELKMRSEENEGTDDIIAKLESLMARHGKD